MPKYRVTETRTIEFTCTEADLTTAPYNDRFASAAHLADQKHASAWSVSRLDIELLDE